MRVLLKTEEEASGMNQLGLDHVLGTELETEGFLDVKDYGRIYETSRGYLVPDELVAKVINE